MIECTHVYKKYKKGVNALFDINLKIDQGEFVYIIGPTGSGKSTLIKLLDGEEIPTKGRAENHPVYAVCQRGYADGTGGSDPV